MKRRAPKNSLEQFRADLQILNSNQVVKKWIATGNCAMVSDQEYLALRKDVSSHFKVGQDEVLIVGSAKLGFSLSPKKLFREFNDTSDIDVVIISSELFDSIWKRVYFLYQEKVYWDAFPSFKDYLFLGWIRPDFLPPSTQFELAKDWWEYFRLLTSSGLFGRYKIRAALYKDWDFFEQYHLKNIESIKLEYEN